MLESAQLDLRLSTASPACHREVYSDRCCLPYAYRRSPISLQLTVYDIINMPMIHNCYMAMKHGADVTFEALSECVNDICRWFLENEMLLKTSKTEAMLSGTRLQRDKIDTAVGVDVAGALIQFSDSVKLLGVNLDATLSFDRHVN